MTVVILVILEVIKLGACMSLVFVFETMECDWDGVKVIRGIFSDANEAVEYIRNNYFLLDDKRDICIPNYPIKGDVFKQYGYELYPYEVFYDEDEDTYFTTYDTDEGEYAENLNTRTIFTLRGIVLDELLK